MIEVIGILPQDRPIVLFDGTCAFCNRSVQFILDHERDHDLMFAAIQSPRTGEILAEKLGDSSASVRVRDLTTADGSPASLAIVAGHQLHTESTAALHIAQHLDAPWRWLRLFGLVPRSGRDLAYRCFARHRYRWFGRTDACRMPTHHSRDRFLT